MEGALEQRKNGEKSGVEGKKERGSEVEKGERKTTSVSEYIVSNEKYAW
jgi:hypothetical protein